MNLYLVLALALGTVSGTAAPVAQPLFTHVVAESGARSERAVRPASGCAVSSDSNVSPARRPLPAARPVLTGAATPRAPAIIR